MADRALLETRLLVKVNDGNYLTSTGDSRTTVNVVKQLLRIVLVLGALVGLFGQAAALTRLPEIAVGAHVAMADDCMQQMAQVKVTKPEKPCRGLTLDCISAMGCLVNATLAEPAVVPVATSVAARLPLPSGGATLAGRAVAPDLDPPSLI